MMKKLFLLLLLVSCNFYTLPSQHPSFDDLGVDEKQFNTFEKIGIYIETNIETIPFQDCFILPWDMVHYKKGSYREKCGLFLWMAQEAELIEYGYIICGGDRFATRNYYATDELKNPLYNFIGWMAVNTYSSETLDNYLYTASQNVCLKITTKEGDK